MLTPLSLALALTAGDFRCDRQQENWQRSGLDAPCRVLVGAGPAQVAAAKKAWKLTDEAAACAVASNRAQGPARIEAWAKCVEASPAAFPLWLVLINEQYSGTSRGVPNARWRSLEAALNGLADPTPVAERLLKTEFSPGPLAARVLLARHPERLAEVLSPVRLHADQGLEVAWPLITGAPQRKPPFTADEWLLLADVALRGALGRSPRLASELWDALPAATRAAITRRPLVDYVSQMSGADLHFESVPSGDLRLELALALALANRKDDARAVLRALPADGGVACCDDQRRTTLLPALLDFALDGRRTVSPWEAALEVATSHDSLSAELLPLVVAFLSPYERFARSRVADELSDEAQGWTRDEGLDGEVNQRLAAIRAETVKALAALPFGAADGGVGAVADAGTSLVVLPTPPWRFRERKSRWTGVAGVAVERPEVRGFSPVRAEKAGERTAVLALSQRLDPVGEVSPGGYWLLLSDDGERWEQLYLGFADHRPWHANQASAVPLLDGEVLRLDVDEAPLDDRTITFPPLGTRAGTKRSHVVLEAKLADLRRDTDGDGLTDIVEARLLLDATLPDTDGDGVPDGDDPTPRLDDRLPRTAMAEVLNGFFEQFNARRQPAALIVPPAAPDAGLGYALGQRRSADLDDVRFLEGTPETLGGLRPLSRLVTLSTAELEAARRLFGDFYPMDVQVTLSLDGQHAYVSWSERWRGGAFRADRDADGHWVFIMVSSWIT